MSVDSIKNKASLKITTSGGDNVVFSNETEISIVKLTIVKSADVSFVVSGDKIKYSFVCTNVGTSNVNHITFSDVLQSGTSYVANTFKINSSIVTSTISGQVVSYVIPSMDSLEVINIEFETLVE